MHKTDGKLFCVTAPIPGAGAGEGQCVGGGGPRDGRQHGVNPILPHYKDETVRKRENRNKRKRNVESQNRGYVVKVIRIYRYKMRCWWVY